MKLAEWNVESMKHQRSPFPKILLFALTSDGVSDRLSGGTMEEMRRFGIRSLAIGAVVENDLYPPAGMIEFPRVTKPIPDLVDVWLRYDGLFWAPYAMRGQDQIEVPEGLRYGTEPITSAIYRLLTAEEVLVLARKRIWGGNPLPMNEAIADAITMVLRRGQAPCAACRLIEYCAGSPPLGADVVPHTCRRSP